MHSFAQCRFFWFVISIVLSTFSYISVVAADSGSNESVTWNWPAVNDGPEQVTNKIETFNTIETLNASWTSNLDFNPFLVVWCLAPHGWVANQSGSVPPSGWHLVPLNLGIEAPYPLSCHLGFDDPNHHELPTSSANSGNFNITNITDNNPQIVGQSTSMAADSAAASATASTTGAAAGTTTVVVHSVTASSGVSGAAIAGIVIGVLVGVGFILGTLLLLCLRKRRRGKRKDDAGGKAEGDAPSLPSRPPVFAFQEMAADPKPAGELLADTEPVLEKYGLQQRAELPTVHEPKGPVEMEGSNKFIGKMKGKSLKR